MSSGSKGTRAAAGGGAAKRSPEEEKMEKLVKFLTDKDDVYSNGASTLEVLSWVDEWDATSWEEREKAAEKVGYTGFIDETGWHDIAFYDKITKQNVTEMNQEIGNFRDGYNDNGDVTIDIVGKDGKNYWLTAYDDINDLNPVLKKGGREVNMSKVDYMILNNVGYKTTWVSGEGAIERVFKYQGGAFFKNGKKIHSAY